MSVAVIIVVSNIVVVIVVIAVVVSVVVVLDKFVRHASMSRMLTFRMATFFTQF